MDGIEPKIEIFKPFGEAFELMKKILFQPFDFKKWLIIGFAAFLTYLNGGGFTGFRPPGSGNWVNHLSHDREGVRSFIDQFGPIWLGLIGAGILVLLLILVVLMWVRARGHFVFIDCIVRNRAAIVEPWKEYRVEGNSYFVFSLLIGFAIAGLIVLLAALIIVPALLWGSHGRHSLIFVPVLMFAGIFLIIVFLGTVIQFVAAVMYRRRCPAGAAFRDLLKLLSQRLGVFVLYFLFSIVLGIATALVMIIAICATCCIAAIPYVGTVILLPVFVFMQAFSLLFLRQFGPEYDVWQGGAQIEPAPASSSLPPPTPPPIQS